VVWAFSRYWPNAVIPTMGYDRPMRALQRLFPVPALLGLLALAACDGVAQGGRDRASEQVTVGGKPVSDVFADSRVRDLALDACRGDAASVAADVREGVDPNARGLEGVTPIFWALACDSVPGADALLRVGADPNLLTDPPNTLSAVEVAATRDPQLLQTVLRYGGSPSAAALDEAFGRGMDLAPSCACERGWENYHLLLDAGADINADYRGRTIAEFAATLNQFDKVADLLDRGYNTRLSWLGRLMEDINMPLVPREQVEWIPRVRERLEARGVRFPAQRD
jgi:hypothetical protein